MSFNNIRQAYKRAQHFAVPHYEGEFSPLHPVPGPTMLARNMCDFIDNLPTSYRKKLDIDGMGPPAPGSAWPAYPYTKGPDFIGPCEPITRDYQQYLHILNYWAERINAYVDTHEVKTDIEAQIALTCFLHRCFFDPMRL